MWDGAALEKILSPDSVGVSSQSNLSRSQGLGPQRPCVPAQYLPKHDEQRIVEEEELMNP